MAYWARGAARLLRLSTSSGHSTEQLCTKLQWNAYLPQNAADYRGQSARWLSSLSVAETFWTDHQLPRPVASLLNNRGLSTLQRAEPRMLKLYVGSAGLVGDPYKRPPPKLPFLQRWFTREGWQQRKERITSVVKTAYTIARVRRNIKGYTQKKFYKEATDLYKQINSALAAGDRSSLRQLVTESAFSGMKKQLKDRENGKWARVDWELAGPIKRVGTVHGRMLGIDQKNPDNAFAQLTLRILSNHKFAAYDKSGKLVAGDPDKEVLVEDFWVFEKLLSDPESKWRLCGRLTI